MQLWPLTTLQRKKKKLGDYNMKERRHVEFKHPTAPVAGIKRMNGCIYFVSDQTHSVLNKFSFFSQHAATRLAFPSRPWL